MERYDKQPAQFKVIILGDMDVGKSTVFQRLNNSSFRYQPPRDKVTVKPNSCYRTVYVNDTPIVLKIWDTADTERLHSLTRSYYRNAHGVLFVYSVEEPASFYALAKAMHNVQMYAPQALRFLLGTKADLQMTVEPENITRFAREHHCACAFVISGRTGAGIAQAIQKIAERLYIAFQKSQGEDRMKICLSLDRAMVHHPFEVKDAEERKACAC